MSNFHKRNIGVTATVESVTIERDELRPFLDDLTRDPTLIFSVECKRRTDLELRYLPPDDFSEGPLCYIGDASDGRTQERIRACPSCGRDLKLTARGCNGKDGCGLKRAKIVLQPAGTLRTMLCKRKLTDAPMKHWAGPKWVIRELGSDRIVTGNGAPPRGMFDDEAQARTWFATTDLDPERHTVEKARLHFDPESRGLYQVAGMYNDDAKDMGCGRMDGRHGQWRPWCMIDLETVTQLRYGGRVYAVADAA